MLAPVIVFVYNRPYHTKKTIESLANNILAKESEVYIFSDAPKNELSVQLVDEVRTYINLPEVKEYFKDVKIVCAASNLGLAKSVITGVSQIINEYGKVIVVEDDLITSVDFLQFMNDALDYYKDNKSIWSISGYNLPIKIPDSYKHEVYLSYRGCSWGYGTWKDRWNLVDWEVSDFDIFIKNKALQKQFNRGGRDLTNMLISQMKGKIDSWAIRWCYTQSKLNMFTVYPVDSRVRNIGVDGTGTHKVNALSRYDTLLNNKTDKCKLTYLEANKVILRNFRNFYMSNRKYIVSQVKKIIKDILKKR